MSSDWSLSGPSSCMTRRRGESWLSTCGPTSLFPRPTQAARLGRSSFPPPLFRIRIRMDPRWIWLRRVRIRAPWNWQNSPKFVSLRPENNSFLNVRKRFYFNKENPWDTVKKSTKQNSAKKSAKGNRRTSSQRGPPNSARKGTINWLSLSNSSRSGLTN